MIEKINLHCIFYFIYLFIYLFFETSMKKCACFLFSTPIFITQITGKRRTNKKLNSATFGIQHNFLTRMPQLFGGHKYSKLFQFKFPKTYLPNLCIAGSLKLLEDSFLEYLYSLDLLWFLI